MNYFLNDTITGPYSGSHLGTKGDIVFMISEHGNVCIVEKDGIRFTVASHKLSKVEVEKASEKTVAPVPEYKPSFSKSKGSKKSVTNPQNNIQSLF
jgi:hypothetical protein